MLALPSGTFPNVFALSYQEEASICLASVYLERSHITENNLLRSYGSLCWLFSLLSFFQATKSFWLWSRHYTLVPWLQLVRSCIPSHIRRLLCYLHNLDFNFHSETALTVQIQQNNAKIAFLLGAPAVKTLLLYWENIQSQCWWSSCCLCNTPTEIEGQPDTMQGCSCTMMVLLKVLLDWDSH